MDSSEYIAYLEPQGPGQPPHVRLEPITSTQLFNDRHFFDDLSQVLSQFTNPQSNPGGNGSGDPQLPQFFQENGNGDLPIPFTNFAPTNGTNNPATTTTTFTVVPFAETVQPTIVIAAIETNNTFIATNNIINQVEAKAGVLISGTAAGSNIVGQTVTVDIVNASHTVVESFTTTVQPNGKWSVDMTQAQAQALADGIYTVTASVPGGRGQPPGAGEPDADGRRDVADDYDQRDRWQQRYQ